MSIDTNIRINPANRIDSPHFDDAAPQKVVKTDLGVATSHPKWTATRVALGVMTLGLSEGVRAVVNHVHTKSAAEPRLNTGINVQDSAEEIAMSKSQLRLTTNEERAEQRYIDDPAGMKEKVRIDLSEVRDKRIDLTKGPSDTGSTKSAPSTNTVQIAWSDIAMHLGLTESAKKSIFNAIVMLPLEDPERALESLKDIFSRCFAKIDAEFDLDRFYAAIGKGCNAFNRKDLGICDAEICSELNRLHDFLGTFLDTTLTGTILEGEHRERVIEFLATAVVNRRTAPVQCGLHTQEVVENAAIGTVSPDFIAAVKDGIRNPTIAEPRRSPRIRI